jgi:hypothetical protein
MSSTATNEDTPLSTAERQLITIIAIRDRTLHKLGVGPDEHMDSSRPIEAAVAQRRGFAEHSVVRLDAALAIATAIQAYLDEPTTTTFGRVAWAYEVFSGMTDDADGHAPEVLH